MRAGEIRAAILGNDLPEGDEFAPVIADHAAVDRAWYAKHGFMPINHMVVVSAEAARREAAGGARRLCPAAAAAAAAAPADGMSRAAVFGCGRLWDAVELTLATCADQRLLPRHLSVDEVFAGAEEILGDLGA